MKILYLSNIEWSDDNASGNTASNWFAGMEGMEFASIYRRNSMPNNSVCDKYYQITMTSIIKNFFHKEKIGKAFSYKEYQEQKVARDTSEKGTLERRLINIIHRWKLKSPYAIENVLFRSKRWDNDNFKRFIKDFSPDIVFSFIRASVQEPMFIKSILRICPTCKYVGFLADDVYGLATGYKERTAVEEQIKLADKVYAISDIMCKDYGRRFGTEITTLYKGCEFSLPIKQENNIPRKIVYAGNLYYGRDETLSKLVKVLGEHNKNSNIPIELEIYTTSSVGEKMKDYLNVEGVSRIVGARPYKEILEILNRADVALHVESFDEEQQQVVRYSFSTKITDCLQSGATLMVIGPEGLASVEYARNIPGALVVNDIGGLADAVKKIVNEDLIARAKQNREYAKEHLSIGRIRSGLMADFEELTSGSK